MDELEIGGKKYLSSRRAAREHKYHTDYIGQLIRAGKVAGKKVGRAWYVDAESLDSYLRAEAAGGKTVAAAIQEQQEAEVVAQPEPIVEVEKEIIAEPITVSVIEEEVIEEQVQKIHISTPEPERNIFQKKTSTLTYVDDNEPLLPVLEGFARRNADFVAVPMRRVAQEEEVIEELEEPTVIVERPRAKGFAFRGVPALLFVGVVALVIIAASSSLVATSINVEEGKAASVSLTIK
jgi:hypothetical protein